MFHVAAIDGVPVTSSREGTQRASAGQAVVTIVPFTHRVPVRPLRLTLAGTHLTATASREQSLRRQGGFLQVQGDVIFTPAPGGSYFVAGELKKSGSSLWIADLATGRRVSDRIEPSP